MSSKFESFNQPSAAPKGRTVVMPEGSVNIVVMFKKWLEAKPAKEGKKPPPRRFSALVLEDVDVQREKPKAVAAAPTGEIADLAAGIVPDEPTDTIPIEELKVVEEKAPTVTLKAGTYAYFGIFNPPDVVIKTTFEGQIYTVRGVVYSTYQESAMSEVLTSYMCKLIVPSEKTFADYFSSIPFEMRSFNVERDCVVGDKEYDQTLPSTFIAMRLEQLDSVRRELVKELPTLICRLALPTENFDSAYLMRKPEKAPEQMALTNGVSLTGQGYAPPVLMAYMQLTPDESSIKIIAVPFGGYQNDWVALQIPNLTAWYAMAPLLLPLATGYVVGQIDRKRTDGYQSVANADATAMLYSTLLLDVPEMIRRAGFAIPANEVAGFLSEPITNLRCNGGWETSYANLNMQNTVLNLSNVEGDATGIIEAAKTGAIQCYVVTTHQLDDAEVEALRQDPDVVMKLKDPKKYLGGGKNRTLCVYAVGHGVRKLLSASGKKTKMS